MCTNSLNRPQDRSESILRNAQTIIAPSCTATAGEPLLVKGQGAVVHDADGNDYVDYDCAGGALVFGHADDRTVAALTKAAAKGVGRMGVAEGEIRLAETLIKRFPSVEQVSFYASHDQAIGQAVNVARNVTGRTEIVVCDPSGWRSYDARRTTGSTGAPDGTAASTLPDRLSADLAAVVLRGITNVSSSTPKPWLTRLRTMCSEQGTLFIHDAEPMAVRLPADEFAARFPPGDVMCLGASLASGLSFGVVAGSRRIMAHFAGNRIDRSRGLDLAYAASVSVLEALEDPETHRVLADRSERLRSGLKDAAADSGVALLLDSQAGTVRPSFHGTWAAPGGTNGYNERYGRLRESLLREGVFVPRDPAGCLAVSTAHSQQQIDQTVRAFHTALQTLHSPSAV